MKNPAVSYKRHRFPRQIISNAVWLYFRFPLSLRIVEGNTKCALLAVACTRGSANFQCHQLLGGKADHIAQQTCICALLKKRTTVHIVGHRWCTSGWVQATRPYRKSPMATKPSFTNRWDTINRNQQEPRLGQASPKPASGNLPSCPASERIAVRPRLSGPFFGRPVSSITRNASNAPTILSACRASPVSRETASQSSLEMKWCRRSYWPGANRSAIGSILLRSLGQ